MVECEEQEVGLQILVPRQSDILRPYWDLNLYQNALPSIHGWVIKEEFVILYTEFKWRIGVHFKGFPLNST